MAVTIAASLIKLRYVSVTLYSWQMPFHQPVSINNAIGLSSSSLYTKNNKILPHTIHILIYISLEKVQQFTVRDRVLLNIILLRDGCDVSEIYGKFQDSTHTLDVYRQVTPTFCDPIFKKL